MTSSRWSLVFTVLVALIAIGDVINSSPSFRARRPSALFDPHPPGQPILAERHAPSAEEQDLDEDAELRELVRAAVRELLANERTLEADEMSAINSESGSELSIVKKDKALLCRQTVEADVGCKVSQMKCLV